MIPTFTAIAEQHDLTLSVVGPGRLPLAARPLRSRSRAGERPTGRGCKQVKDDLYDRVIPALDPDIVVVANLGFPARGPSSRRSGRAAARGRARPSYDGMAPGDHVARRSTSSRPVGREGRRARAHPRDAGRHDGPGHLPVAANDRRGVPLRGRPRALGHRVRLPAARPGTTTARSVDLDRLVCPFLPICDPIVDGHVVQIDGHHLSPAAASARPPTSPNTSRTPASSLADRCYRPP